MPVFLQAAPGMSLGKEFDAPSKRLELSSAVKVKTHQFLSKSHCVLDLSVCGKRRRREEKDSDGACRIRPLGVTVLSRIRPAHRHTNTHKHRKQNGVTLGQPLFENAGLGPVMATQRVPCAATNSPLQGWVINGRSNNLRVVHKIIFLSEATCHILTSTAFAATLLIFFNSRTHY